MTKYLSGPFLLKAGLAQKLNARAEADGMYLLCASHRYFLVNLSILLVGGMVSF